MIPIIYKQYNILQIQCINYTHYYIFYDKIYILYINLYKFILFSKIIKIIKIENNIIFIYIYNNMSKVKKILKTKNGGDKGNDFITNIVEEKKEIIKKVKKEKQDVKFDIKVFNKKDTEKVNIIEDNDDISNKSIEDNTDIIEKEYINHLHTGFINTVLSTSVLLHPRQMDNKIYINLKNNLKKQHEGKCYKTYGYIKNIYKIDNIQEELIDMENSECSQKYILTFSCKIYRPIINRELIAKMDKITEKISTAINGPIKIIITPNRINDKKFYTGTSDMIIRIKPNADILTQNHYVKIYVEGMTFADKDELIIIIGFLIDIATPDEIKNYYDDGFIENNIIDDF